MVWDLDNSSSVLASSLWASPLSVTIIVAFVALLALGSCDSEEQPKEAGEVPQTFVSREELPLEVRELLDELNTYENQHGNRHGRFGPRFNVSGEAVAFIEMLQDELRQLGYEPLWTDNEYVLVKRHDSISPSHTEGAP